MLTGNEPPDHSRSSDFHRRHLHALAGLFVQLLKVCQKAGLVSLGHVALDGTRIPANASKHEAKPSASAKQLIHEQMLRSGLEAEAAAAKAAQRQEQAEEAEQEAAEADASGEEQRSKRAMRRARGGRKRADEARKLAIGKTEAAQLDPMSTTVGGSVDPQAMPCRHLPSDAAGNPKPQAQRNHRYAGLRLHPP